jgi:aminoglycoside phosphotransferase (APT) family kinase protein
MAQVHRWNVSGAGLLDAYYPLTGVKENWSHYLLLHLEDHICACTTIGAITPAEADTIRACFASADPLLRSAPLRLLHGDWGHHNIFVEGNKIVAVIDWEDALGGDPAFDIAYWGTFVRPEMLAGFIEGYVTESGPLPSDFEQRYWLYFLRIALSKTVHRHLFSTQDRPNRPPASRRIQQALTKLEEVLA